MGKAKPGHPKGCVGHVGSKHVIPRQGETPEHAMKRVAGKKG